jgi:hypothetical protein
MGIRLLHREFLLESKKKKDHQEDLYVGGG